MDKECVFCDIWEKRRDIIYSDEFFYACLDKFPVSPGHAEIIPKRHVVSILDLTVREWNNLRLSIDTSLKIIESINLKDFYEKNMRNPINDKSKWLCSEMLNHPRINTTPDGYNFGNNDGRAAGRTIDHFHFHIIPRYFGDVEDATGGIRNIIARYGNYRD